MDTIRRVTLFFSIFLIIWSSAAFADSALLTPAQLSGKSPQQLKIMRNTIYARHGLWFHSVALRQYFSQMSWYRPDTTDVNTVDNRLTSTDKANIGLIKRAEAAASTGGGLSTVPSPYAPVTFTRRRMALPYPDLTPPSFTIPHPANNILHTHSYDASTRDVGVDIAFVITPTALFPQPTSDSQELFDLPTGEELALISRDKTTGWLNVIDVKSGTEGWVKANRVRVHYTHHHNPALLFDRQATGTGGDPQIDVKNDSVKMLHIRVGTLIMDIPPHDQKTVTVPPGQTSYYAVAPMVLPAFGHDTLEQGSRYSWRFYIVHHTRF